MISGDQFIAHCILPEEAPRMNSMSCPKRFGQIETN